MANSSQQKGKLRWYETESPVLIIILLIVFFPLGLWSMWKYAKWSSKAKGVITGIITLLVLTNSFNKSPSTQSTVSQVISSSEPVKSARCISAAGNIWTNVRLYRDSSCQQPFAMVLGGSGDRVTIRFDTGEVEVKTRDAVKYQAYVMNNDPAIDAQVWLPRN
jgi:hypothetical protein